MGRISYAIVVGLRLRSEAVRAIDQVLEFVGYKRRFYGSKGQDRWLTQRVFPNEGGYYFVEVGAGDGRISSNTYVLERDHGWTGVVVEANPNFATVLRQNRKCQCVLVCADSTKTECDFFCFGHLGGIIAEDTDNSWTMRRSLLAKYPENIVKVGCQSLEQILESVRAPKLIGFLSIDVEGAEFRVLKNFPFDRYSFDAIAVERPTKEVHSLLTGAGYILDRIYRHDGFYLSKARASLIGATPMSFEGMSPKNF